MPSGNCVPIWRRIVGGERGAFADLMLNPDVHVHHARRLETGREHASKIRHAVRERVDVRAARHRRLRRQKLRLQVLNCCRHRNRILSFAENRAADRLTADLGCDINW